MGQGRKTDKDPDAQLCTGLGACRCLSSQSLSCADAEGSPDLCTPLRHEFEGADRSPKDALVILGGASSQSIASMQHGKDSCGSETLTAPEHQQSMYAKLCEVAFKGSVQY